MDIKMTNPISRFLIIVLSTLLMFPACEDEEKKISHSTIEFSMELQSINEGDVATILLTLDKPSPGGSSVELTLETNAVYDQHYVTDPGLSSATSILLNISQGKQSAELQLTSFDNSKYEGTKFIILQLKNATGQLRLGEATTLTVTIGDDEGPSLVNFSTRSAFLEEKQDEGIEVHIPLSAPALGEGSVTVALAPGGAVNNVDFSIDQEVKDNTFSLNVVQNAPSVSFTVFPTDNDLFTGNFILRFSISETSGVVQKGSALEYSLTLVDDELPSIAKFTSTSGSIRETDGGGIALEIALSSPAKGDGYIEIKGGSEKAVYGVDFTTLPPMENNKLIINISYDQTGADFNVFPIDNDLATGDLTQSFTIVDGGGVVRRGSTDISYLLTIDDDDEPSYASFGFGALWVDEVESEGIEVGIEFSSPTRKGGHITLGLEGYKGTFTSNPPIIEGYEYYDYYDYSYHHSSYSIQLEVAPNAEGANFFIFPIDDNKCNDIKPTTFTIIAVGGPIGMGENLSFDLAIRDDEDPMIVTLQETEGILNENDAGGKDIVLQFSKPAVTDGLIFVALDFYNKHDQRRYTTNPEMVYDAGSGSYASLNFKEGDTSVKLKVLPANDNSANGSFTERFHLHFRSAPNPDDNCVQIKDPTYTLAFVDDD